MPLPLPSPSLKPLSLPLLKKELEQLHTTADFKVEFNFYAQCDVEINNLL